jgi:hypothetical protein
MNITMMENAFAVFALFLLFFSFILQQQLELWMLANQLRVSGS